MTVRKLTLEEWFTVYQLQAIQARHFHLPIFLEADVSGLAERYRARGRKPPWTSILVRAAGQLVVRHPELNRILFHTLLGPRFVEPGYVAVNVPVLVEHPSGPHLTAAIIQGAHQKTVEEIHAELQAARKRPLEELPIGRRFIKNRNTWWARQQLKLIHFLAWRFPSFFLRHGGGGISVSSLLLHQRSELPIGAPAFGPNVFSLAVTGIVEREGVTTVRLGIGFDHLALRGEQAMAAVASLQEILGGLDPGGDS